MAEQLNIAELRRLISVVREPRHGIGCVAADCELATAARNALPALLDAAEENAALAADLADAEAAISALDCHYGATEELGHDCHDATPCMREMLEAQRDAAAEERDRLKAKMAAVDCRDDAQCDTPRRCSEDRPCQWHLLTAQCFDARMAWSKERTENFSLKAKLAALAEIHPFRKWSDSDGDVLWFTMPVKEPPFHVGRPDDSDWPFDNDPDTIGPDTRIGWSRMPQVNGDVAVKAKGS